MRRASNPAGWPPVFTDDPLVAGIMIKAVHITELQRYNYSYGQVTQSSGSIDTSKNNGQIGRIDGFINGAATKEWDQRFVYDELGRLKTAAEYLGSNSSLTWIQQYTFDRLAIARHLFLISLTHHQFNNFRPLWYEA